MAAAWPPDAPPRMSTSARCSVTLRSLPGSRRPPRAASPCAPCAQPPPRRAPWPNRLRRHVDGRLVAVDQPRHQGAQRLIDPIEALVLEQVVDELPVDQPRIRE